MSSELGTHGEQQPDDGLHPNHAWEFADEASRLAFTAAAGDPNTLAGMQGRWPKDRYKECVQTDTNARYMLIGNVPTWLESTPGTVLQATNKVEIIIRKSTAGTLAKGRAVYNAGHDGTRILCELARSDADATMDAIGLCSEAATDVADGRVMVYGQLDGVDTSSFSNNDNLHISDSVAGDVQASPPNGPAIHQNIGLVSRVHASLGEILVQAQGSEPFGISPEPTLPQPIGAALAAGTDPRAARLGHVHTHGDQASSNTMHAVAIPAGNAGFMSGADKTKLDEVASGASATFTGLTDTENTYTGASRKVQRVNDGETALESVEIPICRKEFDGWNLGPVFSDGAINVSADFQPDSANASIPVIAYDSAAIEERIGSLWIPPGVTRLRFDFNTRGEGAAGNVVPRVAFRLRTAVPGAWGANFSFTPLVFAAATDFLLDAQTVTLATLGLTAGNPYQISVQRNPTDGSDSLGDDWIVAGLMVSGE